MIFNRISPLIERLIPKEQAGFMERLSCTDHVLSLTNFVEQGCQKKIKTDVAFIDLMAAYGTIWKKGLMYKLMKTIRCRRLCDFIMTFLSDRYICVYNGLPQGSVLACTLFNLYIHDLPGSAARKFIYADDKAYAYQARSLRTISRVLTRDLKSYTEYCRHWRLVPSESKTVTCSFHLDNGQMDAELLTWYSAPS